LSDRTLEIPPPTTEVAGIGKEANPLIEITNLNPEPAGALTSHVAAC
jgi:hypothetical protein